MIKTFAEMIEDCEIHIGPKHIQPALWNASEAGHLEVVGALIGLIKDCRIQMEAEHVQQAVSHAMENKQPRVAELLKALLT